MQDHDYVVVGGGSAGCVVAGELARRNLGSVLLLEHGERAERHPETLRVDGYRHAFINDSLMFERHTVPQTGCDGRRIFVGSGRGLGGSGSINAMVYLRGAREDFAQWGVDSWRWEALLDDYLQLERRLVIERRAPTAFTEACIDAAGEAGFRRSADLNDGRLDGAIGYEWMNFRGDRRRSSYVAFLEPQLARDALSLETEARASRVLFRDGRAIGVEYHRAGEARRARARREVVLCAGALETPRLLLASGVGPRQQLQRLGIRCVADIGAVGENLQDHPNVTLFFKACREIDCYYPQLYSFHRANVGSDLVPSQPDTCYVFYPARSSLREGMMRLLPSMVLPDALREHQHARRAVQSSVALAFRSAWLRRLVSKIYGIVVILGKPRSRGSVRIASPSADRPALVDPAYYTAREDMETMVRAVGLARRIASGRGLSQLGNREIFPGPMARSPRRLEAFIRANTITTYHYGGSCRMGEDPGSVVDPRLRVRGVRGLRIADASIMPVVPVSALNAPSMLIGWRAAGFVAEA